MTKIVSTDKEIREFLETKIDKILDERKKERKTKKEKKLFEEKKQKAETKIIESVKSSLYKTLKDVDWDNLNVKTASKLIKNVDKWVKQYTKK